MIMAIVIVKSYFTILMQAHDIVKSILLHYMNQEVSKRETVIHLNKVVVRPLWLSLELNIPFTRLAFYMRSI